MRVMAGAGSGKTRTLVHRFAFLVNEIGILPGNILCVTFTNKAAGEMRTRIHNLTGDDDTGYICTFHSFCAAILHEDAHCIQYPESFLVLDNADIDAMHCHGLRRAWLNAAAHDVFRCAGQNRTVKTKGAAGVLFGFDPAVDCRIKAEI